MKETKCSICKERMDFSVKTQYGDICSVKCFRELCDDILGANEEDFTTEEEEEKM